MVVSAILTTALAPITGALFGASYGTSIRIGYEIIFPALFGDVINEQKNNPTKLQEQGTKRTIESMHKMFTGVGGAAAMEFGIEQGIEMAKKKIESPDVQNMIDSNLGLTDRQLNKRGKAQQFQDPLKGDKGFPEVGSFFEKNLGDFQGQSNREITQFFKAFARREPFDNAFKLLQKEKGNTTFTRQIWLLRPKASNVQEAIDKSSSGIVKQIATQFNKIRHILAGMKTQFKAQGRKWINGTQYNAMKSQFLREAKAYNRLVQANRKPQLAVDTAKSITQMRIISR